MVIATDSEYVAVNATQRVERWETEGWRLADGISLVKNLDLWKLLLREIRQLQGNGVNISFWRIPREWNERADKYAKLAAESVGRAQFRRIIPHGPLKSRFIPLDYP